ncbi:hypothetical protein [Thiohalorhabdus sp.]|uniref:hypothetical protein n=1 Tax=Thiohalorhabdus sp. TaxID=3094134 RepID=UPI002FC30DDD
MVGYLGIAAYAFFGQTGLVYQPDLLGRAVSSTPADIGLSYEPVELVTDDQVTVHGWYVPAAPERAVAAFGGRVRSFLLPHAGCAIVHRHWAHLTPCFIGMQ